MDPNALATSLLAHCADVAKYPTHRQPSLTVSLFREQLRTLTSWLRKGGPDPVDATLLCMKLEEYTGATCDADDHAIRNTLKALQA